MKRVALFALVCAAMIAGVAAVAALMVKGDGAAKAVWISAVVALVVQVGAFAFLRFTQTANVVAGWGAGMLIRFFALAAYGLVGAKALDLAMAPALLSFAGFLFLTTLVEPVFLKP